MAIDTQDDPARIVQLWDLRCADARKYDFKPVRGEQYTPESVSKASKFSYKYLIAPPLDSHVNSIQRVGHYYWFNCSAFIMWAITVQDLHTSIDIQKAVEPLLPGPLDGKEVRLMCKQLASLGILDAYVRIKGTKAFTYEFHVSWGEVVECDVLRNELASGEVMTIADFNSRAYAAGVTREVDWIPSVPRDTPSEPVPEHKLADVDEGEVLG